MPARCSASTRSPSAGIVLQGDSATLGATINLQSTNLRLDTSTAAIDTTVGAVAKDVIWLHPTCSDCHIYVGDGNNSHADNYSLSTAELNAVDSAATATLINGDYPVLSTSPTRAA